MRSCLRSSLRADETGEEVPSPAVDAYHALIALFPCIMDVDMRYPFKLTTILVLIVLPMSGLSLWAEEPWVELINDNKLDAFTGKLDGWKFAKSVRLDAKNTRKLAWEEGTGMIVNGEKGRAKDLYTQQKYGDLEIHVEFLIAKGSNSGVKFHGLYEIQILDSAGKNVKDLTGDSCGGIYPRAEQSPKYHYLDQGVAPKINSAKPAGEWQVLDARFQAARFDAEGKKTANARIVRATLNGEVIHENQELATPTGSNWKRKEMAVGPLMFQGDHGPVAFRNLRLRPVK